jgi:hypothetical protein
VFVAIKQILLNFETIFPGKAQNKNPKIAKRNFPSNTPK